jgi:AcrR family transcriptional regulator
MARRIPEQRFDQLVRKATEVFVARGYRLTQMSDIAEAVGVAKGTLYGYVESKDALLLLCLRFADETGTIAVPEALPLPAPAAGEISLRTKSGLARSTALPELTAALQADRAEDPSLELRAVVGEFYDLMSANRHRIKLLDRCMDHPELAELWQASGREHARLAFVRYLEARIRSGQVRRVPNVRLAARMIIETCATWAVHIHWDRAPESYDATEARANAIEFLVRGLIA